MKPRFWILNLNFSFFLGTWLSDFRVSKNDAEVFLFFLNKVAHEVKKDFWIPEDWPISQPFVELDGSLVGFSGEIRKNFAQIERHFCAIL